MKTKKEAITAWRKLLTVFFKWVLGWSVVLGFILTLKHYFAPVRVFTEKVGMCICIVAPIGLGICVLYAAYIIIKGLFFNDSQET